MPTWTPTEIGMHIAFNLLLAWYCSRCAKRLKRDPFKWFIASVFFGVFAFIALYIAASRKARRSIPLQQSAPKPPVLLLITPSHAERFWYYLNDKNEQFGPMSFNALARAWNEGAIQELTYVWNEEMENWQRFKEVITEQEPSKA